MGRPSGTAHTMIVTATVTALMTSSIHSAKFSGGSPPRIVRSMTPTMIAAAPK